jgi:glycosyltransferase involved in cell wall biosynthesis
VPDPLVSVLLPAWQAAATLPACLRSIARQTEPRWECILVDDGSTDDTPRIAAEAAQDDARVRILTTPHGGIVAALQAGLAVCRGRWVARMDADDLMHRHRLRDQLAALAADPTLVAVGTHVRLFPRAAMRDGLRDYERWLRSITTAAQVRADAFVESPIVHPTLMIDRLRLTALGYREVAWPEDYDLVLRLLGAGDHVGIVPRRLLSWRDGPGRLTRAHPRYSRAQLTACKAAFLASDFLAGTDRYILWGYGDTGRALRTALGAHGRWPSYIIELHPGRLGNAIHGAPVVPYERLPGLPRLPIVVSVAGAEPRAQIRAALAGLGFVERRDFVCAA